MLHNLIIVTGQRGSYKTVIANAIKSVNEANGCRTLISTYRIIVPTQEVLENMGNYDLVIVEIQRIETVSSVLIQHAKQIIKTNIKGEV